MLAGADAVFCVFFVDKNMVEQNKCLESSIQEKHNLLYIEIIYSVNIFTRDTVDSSVRHMSYFYTYDILTSVHVFGWCFFL